MATETKSRFWLDKAADEIIKKYPRGKIIISSGISPSASYHIGHFREIMTADALRWAIAERGRKVEHIHVVDNFDPLRKWYDFLPPSKVDYSGYPVALVPDPIGDCHESYADHFYSEFESSLAPMGIQEGVRILKGYEDLYKPGHLNAFLDKALSKTTDIKKVFEKISNRSLPENWTPVWVLNDEGKFEKGDLSTWDIKKHTLNGRNYHNGNAKLDWRLDWPARWAYLKVNVEPFGGQEHGASGGSYDTGAKFAKEVFKIQPPDGTYRYGHIHWKGENFKMSSSKGNVIRPNDALEVMPPEILRYFMVRSLPKNKIFFDTGAGLMNLIDEFSQAQTDKDHAFRDAYDFAVAGTQKHMISSVSFKHLVQVYQAALGDENEILNTLSRTGYGDQVKNEKAVILAELPFVKNWLEKFAPEEVKFTVQQKVPKVVLTDAQRAFLKILGTTIDEFTANMDGQNMHEIIYAAKDQAGIKPPQAFQAIYRVILGKDYGPKAGWFLASLDRDWLVKRLHLQA